MEATVADFSPAHRNTSGHEKGFAWYSADKGGMTWAGVTEASHPLWVAWPIIAAAVKQHGAVKDKPGTWNAVNAALDKDTKLAAMVEDLYRAKYWAPLNLDGEPDQAIANKVYDIAVNMGVGVAKLFLADARKIA